MLENEDENSELDDLLKSKLANLNPEFEESAWEAMEAKLDNFYALYPPQKSPIKKLGTTWYWLPMLILLGIGAYLVINTVHSPQSTDRSKNQVNSPQSTVHSPQVNSNSVKNSQNTDNQVNSPQSIVDSPQINSNSVKNSQNTDNQVNSPQSTVDSPQVNSNSVKNSQNIDNQVNSPQSTVHSPQVNSNSVKNSQNIDNQVNSPQSTVHSPQVNSNSVKNSQNTDVQENKRNLKLLDIQSLIKKDITKIFPSNTALDSLIRPIYPADSTLPLIARNSPYHLGIMAGMEWDKFTLSANYKSAPTIGLWNEYFLNKKLSLNLGISYSRKNYEIKEFNQASQLFANAQKLASASFVNLDGIYSGTQVEINLIEIPIELRLYFQNKKRFNFFLSTGLSSYIFINQTFTNDFGQYDYVATTPGVAIATKDFNNFEAKVQAYLPSHLNLGLGLNIALSSKISVQLNPVYKLPLRQIGQEKTLLSTYGLRSIWAIKL